MIYMDNAATTPITTEVLNSMLPYLQNEYGNPSSAYSIGRNSKKAIEKSRKQVAKAINATQNDIYFTSGGSEANNWALIGVALKARQDTGKDHIVTSSIEHHSVLNTCKFLESIGFDISYAQPNTSGIVSLDEVKNCIKDRTIIVSVMYVNNEIGTIQHIDKISELCTNKNILFHTDAVQAIGNIEIDVKQLNIDMLSLSGHKFHAPKGIGSLYIKNGTKIINLINGGKQEFSKRAGTENVAGIVGMGNAIDIAVSNINSKTKYIKNLRDELILRLLEIPDTIINGDIVSRVCGNINISFKNIEGESVLLMLDNKNICVSAGSACSSGKLGLSHVLQAIKTPQEYSYGAIRLSLCEYNTLDEIDLVIEEIKSIVNKLRGGCAYSN